MPSRYWVGGTATWDATAGFKWATTSGGVGGASVPTLGDNVYFDSNSGSGTVTIASGRQCDSLICTGFAGTLAGTGQLEVQFDVVLVSGMGYTNTGGFLFSGAFTKNLTTAGKTIGAITLNASSGQLTLQDAVNSSGALTVTAGTLNTNNYSVTATSLSSNNSNTRTINLGSSTVTLSLVGQAILFSTTTNLTFNAGTSQIILSGAGSDISVGGSGVTFHNVSFTSTSVSGIREFQGAGQNVFNNLSIAGATSSGILLVTFAANQTINGTLTLSAGTNATCRMFLQSSTIGTARTLTVNSFAAGSADVDFRDITIAGSAAPISGTRFGDCKGNSGITFASGKTVYWNLAGSNNWSDTGWASSAGGTPFSSNFPLAQDTAVFTSTSPGSGTTTTINAAYNVGTIDMSARTTNTMTLSTSNITPVIHGNWINGTGTTLTGTGSITFAGRATQTITSSGKSFPQNISISSPGGTVQAGDNFSTSGTAFIALVYGTLSGNGYSVATDSFFSSYSNTRTLAIGSGAWSIGGSGTAFNCSTATNLTVTGTGTISLTSGSAKTFAGGGIQNYPTINQGGTGTLTITGSNGFADITNTAIGRVQFTGGTTNSFNNFSLSGTSGNLIQLGSSNTTKANLQKASAWLMGANSTDGGNNTGLVFTAGGGVDYLSVSYINGQSGAGQASGNFLMFF